MREYSVFASISFRLNHNFHFFYLFLIFIGCGYHRVILKIFGGENDLHHEYEFSNCSKRSLLLVDFFFVRRYVGRPFGNFLSSPLITYRKYSQRFICSTSPFVHGACEVLGFCLLLYK